MAENKKSFVIYCDVIQAIDHLTNEEKGKLFQHLLEYVNDLNPILEDRILLGVWKHIELQLKRDLKKYERRCDRNRENGKLGGRPKNPKKPKEPTGLIQNPTKAKKPDTDNDTDNDILKRELEFKNSLKQYSNLYSKDMLNRFYLYWSERKPKGRKMRFEMEKVFDTSRRLVTWNNNNFGNKQEKQFKPTILGI